MYQITTTKQDAARKARNPRKVSGTLQALALAAVLIACALVASYGDTITGVNPAPAAYEN